jgi:anti-sigma factor RsiW
VTCELSRSLLHGYLDGELDAVRSGEFERHLESCSECIAQLGEQESLRASLQSAQLYALAPATLSVKIRRHIANKEAGGKRSASRLWQWAAAVAAIAILVTATYIGMGRVLLVRSTAEQAALTEVIDAHVRSLQPGHLTDVASTDQHTVKPWFAGKLDYVPPVRDLAESGFPLIGGRLDVLNGRSVAVLVYGRRKHSIDVFVWPERAQETLIPASGTHNGYQWIYSHAHGMEFCVISDVSAADLHDLAELLQE